MKKIKLFLPVILPIIFLILIILFFYFLNRGQRKPEIYWVPVEESTAPIAPHGDGDGDGDGGGGGTQGTSRKIVDGSPPPSPTTTTSPSPTTTTSPSPTTTTSPSPTTPSLICIDLVRDPITTLNIGDPVTFTCSHQIQNLVFNHYNYRYNIDNGDWQNPTGWQGISGATPEFTIEQEGVYKVQCQVCISQDNSQCTIWGQAQGPMQRLE